MDDRTATDSKQLTGHCGTVYAVSFSPDRANLISASQDGTGECAGVGTPLGGCEASQGPFKSLKIDFSIKGL